MLIEAIDIYRLAIPLRKPLPGPAGRYAALETVFVRARGGELCGWGEASPGNGPLRGEEFSASVFAALKDWLAPALIGAEASSADELAERLAPFRGQSFAKAALDMALWDLRARRQEKSLPEMLGASRGAIDVGLTFDRTESHEEFLERVGAAFAAGFARVKLKMRPGWEIRVVEAVRRECAVGPLAVDYEGALNVNYCETLQRLDDFFLELIEQPFLSQDYVGHGMLQESLRTPVCLDESLHSPADAEMAFDLQSCRCVNLKPGALGGLTAALAVAEAARTNEVATYVGAMPQTTIGARFGFALAGKTGGLAADYFPAEEYLEADVAPPLRPARGADGVQRIELWTGPGLGIDPDPAAIDRWAIDRATVQAGAPITG